MQYIGETENALHIRMNGHRSDTTTKKVEKTVSFHFNQQGHTPEDLRVMGIENIHTERRHLREHYWIFGLRNLTPENLNIDE